MKEHLGRPHNERECSTLKELKAGHWGWNSESQDIKNWDCAAKGAESGEDSEPKGQLQPITGHDQLWETVGTDCFENLGIFRKLC